MAATLASLSDPHHPISVLQSHSLPTLVQKELERLIVAGDLATGAKLNEAAVAEMLGVSRGPVREAFRALEEVGLVRFEKNRGVFVRQISMQEADQIYEVRSALDGYVGRTLARIATPAQVGALAALVARMERAVQRNDVDGYYSLNLEFHETLIGFTGNDKLALTYRRLVNELNLFRRSSLSHPGTLPESLREHRAIVDRIAARDAEGAGAALEAHALGSRSRMHRLQAAGQRLAGTVRKARR